MLVIQTKIGYTGHGVQAEIETQIERADVSWRFESFGCHDRAALAKGGYIEKTTGCGPNIGSLAQLAEAASDTQQAQAMTPD